MSRFIIRTRSPFSFGNRVGDEVFVNTDELTPTEKNILRMWMKHYPEMVTDDATPPPPHEVTPSKPDVVERKAPDVPFVDPIAESLKDDIRFQIASQQMNERLAEYQINQGLVDDAHNATLLRDWIQTYGQGHTAVANVDRAVKALRARLHWQQLSAFTKRLAGF